MDKNRENKLGTMPMERLLLSVSLPLMISMLVQALYNIVDGIYVAQLSETALTATTLAFPAQMLIIAFAGGTGVGINSLLSRRLGERKQEEASMVAMNGLLLALLNALIFFVFGAFFSRPFIAAFTERTDLIEMGSEYLSVCCMYSFGVFIAITGERFLQATGRSLLSMISQMIGAVVNIVLDPLLIFGRAGFPEMGIRGAAVATVIGQCASAVVAMGMNLLWNREVKFRLRGLKPNLSIIVNIYKVGLPSIIMQSLGSVMAASINSILMIFSPTHVAVYGAYTKLQSFVFMPVFGLTQGLVPIIGFNYGARNPRRIKQAIKLGILTAAAIMALGTLVFQLFPDRLLGFFEADSGMLAIGRRALRVISLIFIPASVSIVMGSAFMGMGNGVLSMINSIMRQLVVLLPAAYLLARVGENAVWYAFPIAEVASLVLTVILFAHIYRREIVPLDNAVRRESA